MGTRLQGKVAFVTGAGSGIGAATALRFAEEGARVVLCGRRIEPLQAVAAQIRDSGGCAECAVADVSNEAAYVAAINDAAQRHGRLDILVNNAMAYSWGAIDSTSTADWHSNFATTVDGTFWGTRTAMGLMRAQGSGSIINDLANGQYGTCQGTPNWMASFHLATNANAYMAFPGYVYMPSGVAYNDVFYNYPTEGNVGSPSHVGGATESSVRRSICG